MFEMCKKMTLVNAVCISILLIIRISVFRYCIQILSLFENAYYV
jgi:hypothetical protein